MKKHTFKEGDYVKWSDGTDDDTFRVLTVERNGDMEVANCRTDSSYDLCRPEEFVKAKKPKTMSQLLSELRKKCLTAIYFAHGAKARGKEILKFQREAFKIYRRYT